MTARKAPEWDISIKGSASPQGLVALVGDGLPVRLDDDDWGPSNVLETLTPIQRAVLAARLRGWLEIVEAAA